MRTKQLLLSTAFVAATLGGIAQTKREILAEDPNLSPNLRIELSPLHYLMDENNNFAGFSGKLSYRHNNKFTIAGEFRKEFFDWEEEELKPTEGRAGIAHPEPFAGYGLEFTGTYHFVNKEKFKEEYLPVKSRSVGYRTVEVTVDPIDVARLSLYGLRGGYSIYKATMFADANISEVGNPSNTKLEETVTPLQTRSYVFGGLSYTRIKNIKVHYPNYGTRRKQFIREVYADFMYGTGVKSENVVDYYGVTPVTYQIDELLNEKSIGWRLGVFSTPTGRLINFGYGMEIAKVPGNGLFSFNFKMVFSLGKTLGATEE